MFLGGSNNSPFVIGSSDTLTVGAGDTALYLGLPDALGFQGSPGFYSDNTGGFCVTVNGGGGSCVATTIPEASTWAMMLLGFAGLGFAGYRKVGAGNAMLAS